MTLVHILNFNNNNNFIHFIFIENDIFLQDYINFYNDFIFKKQVISVKKTFEIKIDLSEATQHFLHEKELKQSDITLNDLLNFINCFEMFFSVELPNDTYFLMQEEIFYPQHYILCFEHFSNSCILLECNQTNQSIIQSIIQSSKFLEKIKMYEEYDIVEPEKFQNILNLSVNGVESIEDKLENIECLCDIGSFKNILFTTQQKLQHIILEHYTITTERDKTKCSDLLNKLERLGVSVDKKMLNLVLNNLQVEKKRYSNGFYWVKLKEN